MDATPGGWWYVRVLPVYEWGHVCIICIVTVSVLDGSLSRAADLVSVHGSASVRGTNHESPLTTVGVQASLAILGETAAVDGSAIKTWVAGLQTEAGGLPPRQGDKADVFHTHFGLAALALLGHPDLGPVDPIHCLPPSLVKDTVQSMRSAHL
jgi:hypothetical protein